MNGELEQLLRREATGAVMDCCICSPTASVFRLPRNTICSSCHEGARNMATFFDELYSSQHKVSTLFYTITAENFGSFSGNFGSGTCRCFQEVAGNERSGTRGS